MQLNGTDGKLELGNHKLPLRDGPVIVEEAHRHAKTGRYLWISLGEAG
jgi:hypothetical protein